MPPLDLVQAAMMRAIDHGPQHLPDGLFAATRQRALLGMKVHANTVAHARLVAIEDTFPRTRGAMGAQGFNALSRRYLDRPGTTALPLLRIGRDFADFLAETGESAAMADLARFEWLWLEAYHAADAQAASLAAFAGLDAAALFAVRLLRHPAAHICRFDPAVHRRIGSEVPGLAEAEAILLSRADAEVRVSPASLAMGRVLDKLNAPAAIGNLFGPASEPVGKDELAPDVVMAALIALLEAGALQRAG